MVKREMQENNESSARRKNSADAMQTCSAEACFNWLSNSESGPAGMADPSMSTRSARRAQTSQTTRRRAGLPRRTGRHSTVAQRVSPCRLTQVSLAQLISAVFHLKVNELAEVSLDMTQVSLYMTQVSLVADLIAAQVSLGRRRSSSGAGLPVV